MTEAAGRDSRFDELLQRLRAASMEPLWTASGRTLPPQPSTSMRPFLWRWSDIRQGLFDAAALVPVGSEGADRRVITMQNPGRGSTFGTSDSLMAAAQLLLPNEVAATHRHTMSAIRFIVEGDGATTTVDGETVRMHPGDLTLTPRSSWHNHANDTAGPVLWLDGLDSPLVRSLRQTAYEELDDAERRRAAGDGAAAHVAYPPGSPLGGTLYYPWSDVEARLREARGGSDRFDGTVYRYLRPETGGSVLPTMDCFVHLLSPGESTAAHRHTASAFYHVVRGSGWSVVDGLRMDWNKGDIFVVPTWAWHEHANRSATEDAILFSLSDAPLIRALGLYSEQQFPDGRQPVAEHLRARQPLGATTT